MHSIQLHPEIRGIGLLSHLRKWYNMNWKRAQMDKKASWWKCPGSKQGPGKSPTSPSPPTWLNALSTRRDCRKPSVPHPSGFVHAVPCAQKLFFWLLQAWLLLIHQISAEMSALWKGLSSPSFQSNLSQRLPIPATLSLSLTDDTTSFACLPYNQILRWAEYPWQQRLCLDSGTMLKGTR